ncbi:FMN-binding negative transcriptional regulator [Qipengyuania nanhaisediminis]|uniref:FMN-binding negative transcriptional regulator n=1 Tax=Qipengyuania nanhaisediminis TaxID=604088 RepID=UPI0038B3200F
MHPNPLFRSEDRQAIAKLIADHPLATICIATETGPCTAHAPVLLEGETLLFHLAKNNAITAGLDGARAVAVINGPGGYVSPRWYDARDTVPTWNYAALECEGRVSRLDDAALEAQLHALIARFEGDLGGEPWEAGEASRETWDKLFAGITGFALAVETWRPTFKLSQNKNAAVRARIAGGLAEAGNPGLAAIVERQAP